MSFFKYAPPLHPGSAFWEHPPWLWKQKAKLWKAFSLLPHPHPSENTEDSFLGFTECGEHRAVPPNQQLLKTGGLLPSACVPFSGEISSQVLNSDIFFFLFSPLKRISLRRFLLSSGRKGEQFIWGGVFFHESRAGERISWRREKDRRPPRCSSKPLCGHPVPSDIRGPFLSPHRN